MSSLASEAGVPVTVYGAKETNHRRVNSEIGLPDNPVTQAVYDFIDGALK